MASQPKKRKLEELRLSASCRLLLLYHMSGSRNFTEDEIHPPFREPSLRVLLTSRESMNAFFDSQPRMPCIYVRFDNSYQLQKCVGIKIKFFVEQKDLVALLSLARNLTKLEIRPTCGTWFRQFIPEWMEIAEKINSAPNLTDIEFVSDYVNSSCSHLILDTLPDKITRVHCKANSLVLQLLKRQTFLTELILCGAGKPSAYLAPVFQVKTRRLKFSYMFDLVLSKLADCGPLKRNEAIEELVVYVPFELFQPMSYKFEDGLLVLCSQALRHLRKLNDHFALDLCCELYPGGSRLESVINDIRDILTNVEIFISAAKKLGFGAREDLQLFCKFLVNSKHAGKVPGEVLKEEFGFRLIDEEEENAVGKYYTEVHAVPVYIAFTYYYEE
ncbi:hypothetical protein M3Y94_00894600 [Aphelenchoides besseyi]|nr:hypothetical protein M3Y94_00894600 [Aphelenchoides besseyi]KAI6223410.1 hypothetical protein M3Y95_00887200 [Aphelenchoides besseyi]